MREIFVSYSHNNNQDNVHITHKITRSIDHFLAVYEDEAETPADKSVSAMFFIDRGSIDSGQFISEQIRTAIEDCLVMLAFVSPEYFSSTHCLREWKEFKRFDEAEPGKRLLIPIEVKRVDPSRIPQIDAHMDEWLDELVGGPRARKYGATSSALTSRDTQQLADELRQLDRVIQGHLLKRKGTSGERRAARNILAVSSKIDRDSLKTAEIQAELTAGAGKLKFDRIAPVCVLFAGGTIGMVHQRTSGDAHPDFEMAQSAEALVQVQDVWRKLSILPFNIHIFSLESPIDSSNVRSSDWVNLANLIREQMDAYQGFVVLHGTNTLAYSASALSSLLMDCITKPVVLTGSEVPISVHNTDATHNLENAVRACAWDSYNGPILVPEVCVFWNNQLYRGSRVAKKNASDRADGFHTPNMPVPIGYLANERLNINHEQILTRPEAGKNARAPWQPVVNLSDAKVDVMYIHPGMELSDLDKKFPNSLDGLVLLTYGSGNAPEDPRFIAMIKRLVRNGTIVVNVTQCPYGRVELKLFETSALLFDLGVIDAYDMTPEAAYTKLLWAIARRGNRKQPGVQDSIKRSFQENKAGEMSASIFDTQFGGSDRFDKSSEGNYLVSDVHVLDKRIDPFDISEVFIRLEGLVFKGGARAGRIRILLGKPSEMRRSEVSEVGLLADFLKDMSPTEVAVGSFDKNLEITRNFRKAYVDADCQVSIAVDDVPAFDFTSLRLVIYTKSSRFS